MVRIVEENDKEQWFLLDKHMSSDLFSDKVRNKQGFVYIENNKIVGILRYNLFWDNTPFCTLLFVAEPYRKAGVGTFLMKAWEKSMEIKGYNMTLLSTQVNEEAQHFYRKLGYTDCGGLTMNEKEPLELIMLKRLV